MILSCVPVIYHALARNSSWLFIMPVRYQVIQVRARNSELQISNSNFESRRIITENSARMDRATTKQEGEKRRQECKIILRIRAIHLNKFYKIRMCKSIM